MKITDIEAIIVKQEKIVLIGDGSQDTVLIKVSTDAGITGYGEVDSSPYVVKSVVDAAPSHVVCMGLRAILIGEDPLQIEYLWKKMYELTYYFGRRSAAIHAISGVDMALWDIAGKFYKVPVYRLLGGGFRTEIPAYCSVLMPDSEDGIKRIVDANAGINFRGFKFGWGALGQSPKHDAQLVEWARRHVGDDRDLMIDIGMLWKDCKTAIKTVHALEAYNLKWIEEPFAPDNLEGYKRLCGEVDTWISAGEEVGPLHEFNELINGCGIDLIQPDMSRCGGITVAKKVSDMAVLRGIPLIPHAFKTGILMSASLHLIGAIENALYLEYCKQETVLSKTMIKNHYVPDANGMVQIPQRPGLGFEIDEDTLARYRIN
ncbi:MAG: mandelate racemase/muconate lactonizing enzyme family protein [Clostridia bacterium]|nr:mandelate racemase/muconate lactonizing enzyme family protein [Clostridia bacterium]